MRINNYDELLKVAKSKQGVVFSVAAAEDPEELRVVEKAEQEGIADFILVGDEPKINQIAKDNGFSIRAPIIHSGSLEESAAKAVALVNEGRAHSVMKGMLHSAIFLRAVLNRETGLSSGGVISGVYVVERDEKDGLWAITDAGINIQPDLMGKKAILENAVGLMHALGYEQPKVACLAAQELVNPKMQDTIDAALLSKMADRGQIKGCLVDGPLAFDIAYSMEAVAIKGIKSEVAGQADIMLAPDLTVANAAMKAVNYVGKKEISTLVCGARVPLVFPSRSSSLTSRLLSLAMAVCLVG